jgi:hypothetical protein
MKICFLVLTLFREHGGMKLMDTTFLIHEREMGQKRNAYRLLVVKPEGKRPLGRPRWMWVDNIKMDLREIG